MARTGRTDIGGQWYLMRRLLWLLLPPLVIFVSWLLLLL